MPINDKAVITPASGYIFVGEPGTAPPTPAELSEIYPEFFGAFGIAVKVIRTKAAEEAVEEAAKEPVDPLAEPAPKTGTFVLTVDGTACVSLSAGASAAQVQAALEANPKVGAGNAVAVEGSLSDPYGLRIYFIGALFGKTPVVTIAGTGTSQANVFIRQTAKPWKNIGHTSRDDLPELGYDGGDTEVRGTWQNESLREVETKPLADYVTFNLHQFDSQTFELYYGKDAVPEVSGVFGVAGGTTKPVEKSLLIIIVDGEEKVGFHASKVSIKRDDAVSLKTDEFAALPVKATFLKFRNNLKYSWINETLFAV